MLFFMTVLFLGYLYVNLLSKFKKSTQIKIHIYLVLFALASSLLNLIFYHSLILPNPTWSLLQHLPPTLHILVLIFVSVGFPYFLLSTTSTLLQYWFVKINPKKSPYSLYVTSNIGSLLGLLTYPLVLESSFTLSSQEFLWFAIFLIYLSLILYISKLFSKIPHKSDPQKISVNKIHFSIYIPWLALSTISNIALLATTSQITQSVSPIPFLWILPLTLFLISFIIAFSGDRWYSRNLHSSLLLFSVVCTTLVFSGYIHLPYRQQLGVILFTLFMTNLVCHAELWRSRPVSTHLVPFYITISLGGVIASLFCAVVAPYLFPDLWEFSIYLFLGLLVYLLITLNESENLWQGFQYLVVCVFVAIVMIFRFQSLYGKGDLQSNNASQVLKSRSFYGVLRIIDSNEQAEGPIRRLINGGILHGYQPLNKNIFRPTSYYSLDSGVGQVISKNNKRHLKYPLRVGVIGLGAGTMAAYCEPGDYFRFYEINEEVIDISQKYFSYLSHCKDMAGSIDIIKGDARVSLQKELAENARCRRLYRRLHTSPFAHSRINQDISFPHGQ